MPKNQSNRQPDQRARRTCKRLGDALIHLIQQKPYNKITIQDILTRASVGRSTFYLHYRDKNDLLLSQLEQFMEVMSNWLKANKEKSLRVMPVAEMFAHIAQQMPLYRALQRADRLNDFYDLAQGHFARGIEQRLTESKRLTNVAPPELTVRATAIAGSLISLLKWWLDQNTKEPPRAMDDLFHKMVWEGMQ